MTELNIDIRGVQKTTLIDYPGKIASTIFFNRCNFLCPFCHNPELALDQDENSPINPDEILEDLDKRKNWLDGVCLTGGEPTMHKGLEEFIKSIKKRGLLVKLDTNGTNPNLIETLLKKELIDYIAMDIKAHYDDYDHVVKVKVNKENIKKSTELIRNSSIDYEYRTTVVPPYFNEQDLLKICKWLEGSKHYSLQQFRNDTKMIDMTLKKTAPYNPKKLEEFKEIASKYFKTCEIRGI
ncbi:MAG: anaerobic ribonucleoside-triphosphate reductase activating protein [Candidatus Nanohalarchaeota archaeon]|nr:MAG: anaerobic ribonucleoside-triphosphate reductase activating protein [Candidatus Nanohaloarchaeota archaeon]